MNLREALKDKVREMYDENFKLNGIYGHYIIHPDLLDDEVFAKYVLTEVHNNGLFTARLFYVKRMFEQMKKNKTLEDWQKFAKEFTESFDEDGKPILKKGPIPKEVEDEQK